VTDTEILQGYSKANALFKGYKTIWGGYYELCGDYVGIGSIYTKMADPAKS
jgi:hypothetical protein